MNSDEDTDHSDEDIIRPISRRNAKITPKARNSLFVCSDCYSTIYTCDMFFLCRKCNLKICNLCYEHNGNKCVQGCKKISTFINPEPKTIQDNIHTYIEVVKIKKKCWPFSLFSFI